MNTADSLHSELFDQAKVHRIVFIGSFGVGKSTAIRTVSDIHALSCEAGISELIAGENVSAEKKTTTVGIDYGEIRISSQERYALFGVPGQPRFAHIWQSVVPTAMGAILLVDASQTQELATCTDWLVRLKGMAPAIKVVIGVTRVSLSDEKSLSAYRHILAKWDPHTPVVAADPRDPRHVRSLIATLLAIPSQPNLDAAGLPGDHK